MTEIYHLRRSGTIDWFGPLTAITGRQQGTDHKLANIETVQAGKPFSTSTKVSAKKPLNRVATALL